MHTHTHIYIDHDLGVVVSIKTNHPEFDWEGLSQLLQG